MTYPKSGKITPYKEFWVSCPTHCLETARVLSGLIFECDMPSAVGRIIRIGNLCFGILKRGDATDAVIYQYAEIGRRDSLSEEYLKTSPEPNDNWSWMVALKHGNWVSIPAFLTFTKEELKHSPVDEIQPQFTSLPGPDIEEYSYDECVWTKEK
jgi:hypothetical protein